MAATWPGKDSRIRKTKGKNGKPDVANVRLTTRMPKPCGQDFAVVVFDEDPQWAANEAKIDLDTKVRNHIRGCRKCRDNGVYTP